MALREWIHRLNMTTGENNIRKKVTVTTQNLVPSVIFRVMHVIADTLTMGPQVACFQDILIQVACFQDILIHGRDIRSVRKVIGDINPDYQVFSDHDSFAPDDFRKPNYAGWGASGLASLTLLNKRAFYIPHCRIHEWRNAKERKVRLGKGRVLWIKARTLSGKMINIVNVYQTTANHPEMQMRIYEVLTRVINAEHEPCILVGKKKTMVAHARGSSEDNSEDFFCACQGLHRIEGTLGQVEELYCVNSTINPRLRKEAESAPGSAPTCVPTTRPIELLGGSAPTLFCENPASCHHCICKKTIHPGLVGSHLPRLSHPFYLYQVDLLPAQSGQPSNTKLCRRPTRQNSSSILAT
jgi:hypothetical protein